MKKDEREKALQVYLKKKGDISNKDLAEAVGVNSMTVGRWKSKYNWDQKLNEHLNKSSSKAGSNLSSDEKKGLKKAAELEKAKELYLDMNGEISNTDLSKAVGVTPVTIAKWKKDYDWPGLLESVEEAPAFTEQPSFVTQRVIDYEEEDFEDEEIPFELEKLDDMLAPEQISNMNRKIATLLERDHLSAEELAQLAEAKADLLEGVQTYLNILQDITNFQF